MPRKKASSERLRRRPQIATRREKLLITGSEGRIGRILVGNLSGFQILRLDRPEARGEGFIPVDLSDSHALAAALEPHLPINFIVHLAADSHVEASWKSVLRDNIDATGNIFEFARQQPRKQRVEKIVFASSNHVTGLYEGRPPSLHLAAKPPLVVTPEMPIRPDGYYAVSKAFGEALGKCFSEMYGISVICLRIGTVLENDDPETDDRCRSTWLSHDDLVHLVTRSLKANVKFGIYYGVSNNTRRFWDISNAKCDLQYEPKDDAETRFKPN